ncbi:MAG: SDR family oxidoreductase [Pseudomonadota bacterium]
MSGLLTKKRAVITGAAQGIGAAFAAGLAEHGAQVLLCDKDDCAHAAKQLSKAGAEAYHALTDVADDADCAALAKAAKAHMDGLDILICNAALFGSLSLKHHRDIPIEEWDAVMAVNVKGVWLPIKHLAPLMDPGGSIITIATNRVFAGSPNMVHYDASKAAVIGMTRSLCRELGADGLRVNCIAPGLTMSENVLKKEGIQERTQSIINSRALKREMLPDDIVGTAVFLASDLSQSITGQTYVVDGGGVLR